MAFLTLSHQAPKVGEKKVFENPFDKQMYIDCINSFGVFTWEDDTPLKQSIIKEYGEECFVERQRAYLSFNKTTLDGKLNINFGKFVISANCKRISCEYLGILFKIKNELATKLWLNEKEIDSVYLKVLMEKYC